MLGFSEVATVYIGTMSVDLLHLGQAVREARRKQHVTLEELARMSGVSKSVLSEVERGATNPTLSTLWNISTALALDPVELFGGRHVRGPRAGRPEDRIERVSDPVIENDEYRYRLVILSRPELAGITELYRLKLGPKGVLESQRHRSGTIEQATVLRGSVEIRSGSGVLALKTEQSARYAADVPHAIVEKAGKPADVLLLVVFS